MTDRAGGHAPRAALVRYVLRGLVVAGVAGAAWLFWSASAQAAPAADPAPNSGPVTLTSLTGLALSAPAESGRPAADVTSMVATLVDVARPVVAAAVAPTAVPDVTAASRGTRHQAGTGQSHQARTGADRRSTVDRQPVTAALRAAAAVPAAAARRLVASPKRKPAASRHTVRPVGDRAGPTRNPDAAGTTRGPGVPGAPGQPWPTPMPALPGSTVGLIGTSTQTSGSTSDGGNAAVPANWFAAGAVARQGPVPAAHVAGRPLTVLVPTVSPD
jgi:hypothetical protein